MEKSPEQRIRWATLKCLSARQTIKTKTLSVSRKNSFRDVEVEASSASRLMVPGGQDGAV